MRLRTCRKELSTAAMDTRVSINVSHHPRRSILASQCSRRNSRMVHPPPSQVELTIRAQAERLRHPKAIVRLNLLRILRTICDVHPQRQGLIAQYDLFDAVESLAENDKAVLVKELAKEIMSQGWMERSISSTGSSESGSISAGSSFSEAWAHRNGDISSDGLGDSEVPLKTAFDPPVRTRGVREPIKAKRNSSYDLTSPFDRTSSNSKDTKRGEAVRGRRIAQILERPTHARTSSAGVTVEEITLKPLRVTKRTSVLQRGVSQTVRK